MQWRFRAWALGLAVAMAGVVVGGCGPSHAHSRYHRLGDPLTLTVAVNDGEASSARGTLHYRGPGEASFTPRDMTPRGRTLWANLPTDDLPAGATIDYYFDVAIDGEPHHLRSPADPYRVTLLARAEHIFHSLDASVRAADADEHVRFTVRAGDYAIDWAKVVYERPGVTGSINAAMQRRAPGWYELTIESSNVVAGDWRYLVEVGVEGGTYRLPPIGRASFRVDDAD